MKPLPRQTSDEILLGDGTTTFAFAAGSGALLGVRGEGAEGVTLLAGGENWRLVLAGTAAAPRSVGPADMAEFAVVSRTPCEAVFRWSGAGADAPEAQVTVHWCSEDGFLSGRLSYTGFTPQAAVEKILFPRVAFEADADTDLLLPLGLGMLVHRAPEALGKNGGPFTSRYLAGGGVQCCACIRAGRGLYFDTRDPDGYIKDSQFELLDGGTGIRYSGGHPLPRETAAQTSYDLPYSATVRPFAGGWFEAAAIYREWAGQQRWAVESARRTASGARREIDDIALWVWNRGTAAEAAEPVAALQKDLGLPVAIDWYWWHNQPYDTAYPRYFPPREGRAPFMRAVARLREQGIFTQVYTNGMLWDMDDPGWAEGGEASAILNADGSVKNYAFNAYIPHRLAFMCGAGEPFRAKMTAVAEEVRALGLSGLYLDVIGCACNTECHNPAHAHPAGGGRYQVQGFRGLITAIAARCPGFPLSTESCAEMFLDLLDAAIMLEPSAERLGWWDFQGHGEVVPLFRAIYADGFRLFGNYAIIDGVPPFDPLWPDSGRRATERDWQALCPDQFFVETARNVAWGLQPTVACLRGGHLQNPKYAQEVEFLKQAARFYHARREFLLRGRMASPGELETPTLTVACLRRMIFTKEGEERLVESRLPAVLHSVWEAQDGRRLLVLANISTVRQACRWSGRDRQVSATLEPRQFAAVALS